MKPFGQPVTEIFDFEEGSRFAALTVVSELKVTELQSDRFAELQSCRIGELQRHLHKVAELHNCEILKLQKHL